MVIPVGLGVGGGLVGVWLGIFRPIPVPIPFRLFFLPIPVGVAKKLFNVMFWVVGVVGAGRLGILVGTGGRCVLLGWLEFVLTFPFPFPIFPIFPFPVALPPLLSCFV